MLVESEGNLELTKKEETTELKYSFKTSYSCGLETYATKFVVAVYPRKHDQQLLEEEFQIYYVNCVELKTATGGLR